MNDETTFRQKLVTLHAITMQLGRIDDLATLYRQAIELGKNQLGFERIGLFITDKDNPDLMRGVYGVDIHGQFRDESAQRYTLSATAIIQAALAAHERYAALEDAPLWDEHQIVGHGWNVMVPLWDGVDAIGWLAADNLLTQTPLTPYISELLSLYGRSLGHLITGLQTKIDLRESEARFRRMVEGIQSDYVIYSYTPDGILQYISPSAEAMFGYTMQTCTGRSWYEIVDMLPDSRTSAQHADTLARQGEIPPMYDIQYRHRNGEVRLLEIKAHPVFQPGSGVVAIEGIAKDITERMNDLQRRIDLQMEQERVNVLRRFLNDASHDLRTPLTTIKTSLYLLESATEPATRQRHHTILKNQIIDLERLLDTMLSILRLAQAVDFHFQPSDLNNMIYLTIEEYRSLAVNRQHDLQFTPGNDIPPVRADIQYLAQAVTHLVTNAIHYTPDGGTIRARTYRQGAEVVIEVQDSGIGIAPTDVPHIFESFYRVDQARSRDKGGAGLGLTIAQKIVDAHGGRIEVQSTPGAGSTFSIWLPVDAEP